MVARLGNINNLYLDLAHNNIGNTNDILGIPIILTKYKQQPKNDNVDVENPQQ
jgi:hypothetical protein